MAREATACYWLLGCLYLISIVLFSISFIPKIRYSRSSGPCWALSAALFLVTFVATLIVCCFTMNWSCIPSRRRSLKKLRDVEDDSSSAASTIGAASQKIDANSRPKSEKASGKGDPEKATDSKPQRISSVGRVTRNWPGHPFPVNESRSPILRQEIDFMGGIARRSEVYHYDPTDNYDDQLMPQRPIYAPVRGNWNKLAWRQTDLDTILERSEEQSSVTIETVLQVPVERKAMCQSTSEPYTT